MKSILSAVFAFFLALSACAADKEWLTDIDEAMKLSEKTGKPILADFSGSDGCIYCIRLDREVFSQKAFKDFAKNNLILLLVDFPSRKAMSDAQKAHNEKLAQKYKDYIRGYPTVLLLDSKGKVLLRTGYESGGAEKYVAFLKSNLPAATVKK
ncbi:MAG: thioredoxin family protein [Victivallales bacterium]|nr:thioredoxin family protein [Victivallales bacterium]